MEKNRLELIREDFQDKFHQIDEIRSNRLAHLAYQLTSFQHDYDQARTQSDLAHMLCHQTVCRQAEQERKIFVLSYR